MFIWIIETGLFFIVGRLAAFYFLGWNSLNNFPQTIATFVVSTTFALILGTRRGSTIFYWCLLAIIFTIRGRKDNKIAKARRDRETEIKKFHEALGLRYVDPLSEYAPYYERRHYGGEP